MFGLALVGAYSPYNRGAVLASCVVLYALTAGVAGYVSGLYYKMLGGEAWVRPRAASFSLSITLVQMNVICSEGHVNNVIISSDQSFHPILLTMLSAASFFYCLSS